MNATFTAAMASQLAELERVVDAPVAPHGYGRDLSCVLDCTDGFAEVNGDTALIVAQAVARRFLTPRGSILDDLDQGRDVRGFLHRPATRDELRAFESQLRAEAMKDERVADAAVQFSVSDGARELTLDVRLTPHHPTLQPFRFVLSVTEASVLLELLEQGGA